MIVVSFRRRTREVSTKRDAAAQPLDVPAESLPEQTRSGLGEVLVARRPRVQVLCTGDELRAPGEPLGPGITQSD